MRQTQESGKEEFVDKPIAEDKSLCSMAKGEGDVNLNDRDLFELESKFIRLICEDDSLEFVSLFKCIWKARVSEFITDADGNAKRKDDENKMSRLLHKLLQLACKLDSVACAKAIVEGETGPSLPVNALDEYGMTALHHAARSHSHNCINLLLHNQARTDIKSKEGQSPLDMALLSKRMQVDWSLASGIAELLRLIGDKDITAVRVLAVNTKDVHQIAYKKALDGQIVSFSVLVIVATNLILSTLVQSNSQPHIQTTIFESLVENAVSLWQIESRSSDNNNSGDSDKGSASSITGSNIQQQRKVLLSEIEILLHFKAGVIKPIRDTKRLTSNAPFLPLVRASQAGDEALVKLLLNGNTDPNEADSDGNSALHWGVRATATNQDTRLICLLLRHGASVSARNRLGLTAVHMAANYGHLQGLQMLLMRDAESVDMVTETKETPLFYAVKNNHYECAMLLLGYGANRQALNLRKQRPVDVAKTQDMREMLNSQSVFQFGKLKKYLMAPASLETASEKGLDNSAKLQLINAGSVNQDQGQHEDSSKLSSYTKTEICRYYESPGGCVRGDKCYFAHGEGELRRVKIGSASQTSCGIPLKLRIPADLNRKVFIGGLSPSVESEDLRDFFESKFGPVADAVVIGSQGGEHLHSRGFGFVTFKHQESVASAVQAHYVEIKGAVPKSMLELMKGSNVQEDEMHKNDREFDARKQSISSSSPSPLDRDHLLGDVQEGRNSAHTTTPLLLPPPSVECPAWVEKFKRWLPIFLGEVSKRLKEGEWYPLSSLKGDFRATCGLELDHISLGYIKLSDFIRSIPGLCRMKIVPVGVGPATHMVILPSLPVPKEHHSRLHQTIESGRSSFVDKGRTYADAAGQIRQGTSIPISAPLQSNQLFTTPEAEAHSNADFSQSGPLLYHQSTCTGKFPIRTKEDVRYLTNLLSDFNVNADGTVLTSTNPNTLVNTYTVNQSAAPINSFTQAKENVKSPVCYNIVDTPRSKFQLAPPVQYNPPSSSESRQGHGHPFLGFLKQGGTSFFTPWTQQKPEAQSSTPTISPKLWEKSPQSVLSPYSPAYTSPSEMGESSINKGNCRVCKERKAVWIAVPCAHRALCTDCRNNLRISQMPLNCFICNHPVDNFIALY